MYFPHLRHRHDFSSHSPASQNFLTPGPHNGTPRVPRAAMEFPFQSAQMHNKVFSPAKKGICRRRGRFLLKIHNIHFIRRKQTFHRDPCANSRRPGKATRADSHTRRQPHASQSATRADSRTPANQPRAPTEPHASQATTHRRQSHTRRRHHQPMPPIRIPSTRTRKQIGQNRYLHSG